MGGYLKRKKLLSDRSLKVKRVCWRQRCFICCIWWFIRFLQNSIIYNPCLNAKNDIHTDISKMQRPELNLFHVTGSGSSIGRDDDSVDAVGWADVMHIVLCYMKCNPSNYSRWTLRLWSTTCLWLCSAQKESSPFKTNFVWSHKRIWNESTPFHVCTVGMFQRTFRLPFNLSTSGVICPLCVPPCRRQPSIASGYATTVCSQIGLH